MPGPKIITDYTDIGGYSPSSIVALGDPITGYLFRTTLSSISTGVEGTVGGTGSIGFIGLQGRQGVSGLGYTGSSGQQGSQGNIGVQGFQGVGGEGPQGFQGLQGLQGYQGASPGFQSSRGHQGFQGNIGLDGIQGRQGLQGYFGVTSSTGFQGFQNSQIVLTGTYSHILVYNSGGTLSTANGFKMQNDNTIFVPGFNGSGGTILSFNNERAQLSSFSINGLTIKVGTGSSSADITKRFTVMNNEVIYNDIYSTGPSPKSGYINSNTSRLNGSVSISSMNLQSTYWSTTGIAFSVSDNIIKDISSLTSSTPGELSYNSFLRSTFQANNVTYTDISNFYIAGSPIITGTSGSGYLNSNSLKVSTGKTLFGGGIKVSSIIEYTDNSDAISNGLTAGDIYRSSDILKIVH